VGSANAGLGFFHVVVDGQAKCQWLNLKNVGIISVTHGQITLKELETENVQDLGC
jgi:hypothetical protein